MSMVAHHLVHLNSHLEVYIVRHTHRAWKKNTVSVSTNSNVSCCGTYGCSNLSLSSHRWVLGKWMSKNPNDYMLNLVPCTNKGRLLSVVRISVFPGVSQM